MHSSMTERAQRVTRSVEVEAFSVSEQGGHRTLHYEANSDLFVTCKAATNGGERAGLVLIELGLDGSNSHRVSAGRGTARLDDDERGNPALYDCQDKDQLEMLTDAIEALTGIRDALAGLHGERWTA